MTDDPKTSAPIPPDDQTRRLTVARPDSDPSLPHLGLVGDTYTILVGGNDTNGRYTLIDMHVPPGGGPRATRKLVAAGQVWFVGLARESRCGCRRSRAEPGRCLTRHGRIHCE
jgi:hypothetical protein